MAGDEQSETMNKMDDFHEGSSEQLLKTSENNHHISFMKSIGLDNYKSIKFNSMESNSMESDPNSNIITSQRVAWLGIIAVMAATAKVSSIVAETSRMMMARKVPMMVKSSVMTGKVPMTIKPSVMTGNFGKALGMRTGSNWMPFTMSGFLRPTTQLSPFLSFCRPKTYFQLQGPTGFSKMEHLNKRDIEQSEVAVNRISDFDQLRIFPVVRHAMIEEIRDLYTLKSTYIKDKADLVISPTPTQRAGIRKMAHPRNGHLSQLPKFEDPNSAEAIFAMAKANEKVRMKVFNFAAETGSGKTWAFLATILSKMKEDDLALFEKGKLEELRAEGQVRSVVLVPTVEMVDQIHSVLTRANKYTMTDIHTKIKGKYREFLAAEPSLNVRAFKWATGTSHVELFNYLKSHGRIDVLVTTPFKLASLAGLENVDRPYKAFAATKYAVFDEADTLFQNKFLRQSEVCLKNMRLLVDVILCSATVTKPYAAAIKSLFPGDVINVHTKLAHTLPRGIRVKTIHTNLPPYNGSKNKCLAQAIYAIYHDGSEPGLVKRIIVFVNKSSDVEPLANVLVTEFGHNRNDIVTMTGDNTIDERRERIRPFVEPAAPVGESKIKVLVTTDLLARGVDFNGVKNVVMYDLPRNSSDLMHRCGRTARMGQTGTVYVLVEKKMRNSWVKGLKNAVKKGYTVM